MSGSADPSRRVAPEPPATRVPRDGAVSGSAVATVTGWDGALIAAVSRRLGHAETGPEVVVDIRGDLDLDTAPLAQATVIQALDDAPRVCLDLTEVQFFGAAGLRVILGARRHAEALGRDFRLSGVHGVTARILVLAGLSPPY